MREEQVLINKSNRKEKTSNEKTKEVRSDRHADRGEEKKNGRWMPPNSPRTRERERELDAFAVNYDRRNSLRWLVIEESDTHRRTDRRVGLACMMNRRILCYLGIDYCCLRRELFF